MGEKFGKEVFLRTLMTYFLSSLGLAVAVTVEVVGKKVAYKAAGSAVVDIAGSQL